MLLFLNLTNSPIYAIIYIERRKKMSEYIPECRVCKKPIDKSKNDWIMPSKNQYYHRKCFKEWKRSDPKDDEEYKKLIYSYLSHDLKVEYQYWMCEQQMKKMVKEGKTLRGILFTLKYFYGIKHGNWLKGHGGLGIVPFVYEEAAQYWVNRENREKGIVDKIEQQIRESAAQEKTVVAQKKVTRRKKISFSLDDEEDDDEC